METKERKKFQDYVGIALFVVALVAYNGAHIYLAYWAITTIKPAVVGWVALFAPAFGDLVMIVYAFIYKAWKVIISVAIAMGIWALFGLIVCILDGKSDNK